MFEVRSADGVRVVYQLKGDNHPALVFVHGWCCDRSYWDAQVPYFARQYTVVTVDLAGHGDSGLGRKVWSMEAFGEDVAAVVRKHNIGQVVLVGHSMGGHVIAEAAACMPERVIGLVGVDTFSDVEKRHTQEECDRKFANLQVDFMQATRDMVRSMFPPTADAALVERIAADMSAAPPHVARSAAKEAHMQDLATAFEKIRAPIRCINSDMGSINIEAAQRHASSFEVVLMSGVGHFIMLEDPIAFNRLLDTIVAEFVSTVDDRLF